MTKIDFVVLNSHVSNSYIVIIYQKHQFLCGKTEKFKMAAFLQIFINFYKLQIWEKTFKFI